MRLTWADPLAEVRALEPAGIVLSGGPASVYDREAPVCDPKVLEMGKPVLGICYGLQWITHQLGGKVEPAERRGDGPAGAGPQKKFPPFPRLPPRAPVWDRH